MKIYFKVSPKFNLFGLKENKKNFKLGCFLKNKFLPVDIDDSNDHDVYNALFVPFITVISRPRLLVGPCSFLLLTSVTV